MGRTLSNALTNTAVYGGITFGLGIACARIGGIFGNVVPGLGMVVGAAVGFIAGTLIGLLLDLNINGKSIIEHVRDGIYSFWVWLFG